jgi:hypothetical protein
MGILKTNVKSWYYLSVILEVIVKRARGFVNTVYRGVFENLMGNNSQSISQEH